MDPGAKARQTLLSLRSLLARHATRDVVGVFLDFCMRRANDLEFQGDLMSPARQGNVLLTLLLSTIEPGNPEPYQPGDWKNTTDLLNEAFGAYNELFWPDAEELHNLSDEWKHVREVAMPAFLQYFNTGLVANPEQVRARISSYLIPFDNALVDAGVISATDALRVADWIGERLERTLADLNAAMDEVSNARDLTTKVAPNLRAARELAQVHFPRLSERLTKARGEFGTVAKSELVAEFGPLGVAYWSGYSIGRGEATPLTFPTEAAAAD